MRSGHVYKHEACIDMYLAVVKVQYTNQEYGKYRVAYVDKNIRRFAADVETVKIKNEDLKRWKYVCPI